MSQIVFVVIAFILAIFLNWKYKINMGLVSATAAFLIGCFLMGLSPGDLKEFIPIKVIFPVVSITMFYGFALENGTLIKLVHHLLHNNKGILSLPAFIFFICFGMGLLGLDAGSTVVIMAPIAMTLTALMKLDALTVAAAVLFGAPMGGNYMFGNGGSIIRGLIEENSDAGNALSMASASFWDGVVLFTLLFFIVFFVRLGKARMRLASQAGQEKKKQEAQSREPFTAAQKKNLVLIGIVVFFITVPAVLGAIFSQSPLAAFSKKMDVGFLALAGALAASCLKLGDLNTVLRKHIPWKILIMVSGISILMGVADACGLIGILSSAVNENVPVQLIPAAIVMIAGIMSLFSSAISVVIPTLFPMVPSIAFNCGLAPGLLYSCIVLGASLTGCSPFSTGGAIVVSSAPEEKGYEKLMYQQLALAAIALIAGALFMSIRRFLY